MTRGAVIFDVDGVLLELTAAEEQLFFESFRELHGIDCLSRDWDSYRSRNDDDIIAEIFETRLGRAPTPGEVDAFKQDYYARLSRHGGDRDMIPGADRTLAELSVHGWMLGIATANLREAARIRLERAGLWRFVERLAFGADGGGHKREVLARAIAASGVPPSRIVYLGDNLNDVDAGLTNGVHFIGFSRDAARRERLRAAGAAHVAGDHPSALAAIRLCLAEDCVV